MDKENMPPEIMEEMEDEVFIKGSDPEGRARVVYRFYPGDTMTCAGPRDEGTLTVLRDGLRIHIERSCNYPLREDCQYPVPEYQIVETDSAAHKKLIFRVVLEKMVDAE